MCQLIRGVYFACTIFHEDKVLVTTEEFPPVVEVDDTYPASVNNDFHWLMKVSESSKMKQYMTSTFEYVIPVRLAVRGVTSKLSDKIWNAA